MKILDDLVSTLDFNVPFIGRASNFFEGFGEMTFPEENFFDLERRSSKEDGEEGPW